jgi:acyl transferase domain-containing protein/acyl carrier protein
VTAAEPGVGYHRIAIVGMAARVPGAANTESFWANLVGGVESFTVLDDERLLADGVSQAHLDEPNYVRLAPLLDDVEGFDARLFGYHAREAQIADPQQRIFLEVSHAALQHAGYDPARYPGSVGVFGGSAPNRYSDAYVYENSKVWPVVGQAAIEFNNAQDYLAARVAYALGLTGPAVSIATACSTSLVAVHLACQSLINGECAMAIAGGVNVRLPYYRGHLWADSSMYSRDGHIRAFDESASGTNFGDGAGAVILKRYDDAVSDGDHIDAVIVGSAVNNDGSRRMSFSAPGVDGQAAVISAALRAAGDIPPDSLGYVEAHGTGTAVGDPIEITALSTAYRQAGSTGKQIIPIGSVKTNVGHLGAAAGVVGLIKAALSIHHGKIPGSLNYQKPNPKINFGETPFYVVRKLAPWPKREGPKRAGVSSFGIGGTNAHVILEEPARQEPADPGRPWQILPLSAKTATALATMRADLTDHVRTHPGQPAADIGYTLQIGRPAHEHRMFFVCQDGEGLAEASGSAGTVVKPEVPKPVVFLFPGQGAQYVDMAADIYATEPVFREVIDDCAELARPWLGCDLRDVLFSGAGAGLDAEQMAARLRQTELTQPAMFVVEYALARLWMSWGVEPFAMIGHSVGEYVAACLAGVFTLPGALEIVATRGRLTQSMPAGAMLSVPLAEADLEPILTDQISLAAVNAPQASVVAGPVDAISALRDRLGAIGIQSRLLQTSHAFHSAMLDPIVGAVREAVARIGPKPPERRFLSTLTGTWITAEQATAPGYWADQLRQTVRYGQACQALSDTGAVFLEVGPGQTLTMLARQILPKGARTVASLGRPGSSVPEARSLASAVGELWSAGVDIDWDAMHRGERRRRVSLPAYPYERRRHWVDPDHDAGERRDAATPSSGDPAFLPAWRRQPLAPAAQATDSSGPWLVFSPGNGPAEAVAGELASRGAAVVRVGVGDGFADLGGQRYRLAPARRDDYDELLKAVDAAVGRPAAVVHGWTATPASDAAFDRAEVGAVSNAGFHSLLCLSQALLDRWPDGAVDLRVLTSYSANVSGADHVEPAKALLHGPCLVIPNEAKLVKCQLIDLSAASLQQLLTELTAPITDTMVAYRGGRRWAADYEPVALPEHTEIPRSLRRRGVYLITGGLGGIGLRVASELARAVAARLILVSRTMLPDRASWDSYPGEQADDRISGCIRSIREIESLGGEVLTVAADVTDEVAMRAAVETAHERFGRVDGVFHAAGVAGGGLAAMRTREQAVAVLAPKVDGTLVIDQLLGDEIDLFVLFSSILAITGEYGQVDYCSANAFLDAFAQARAGSHAYTVAVNWCGWDDIGMIVKARSAVPSAVQPADQSERLGDEAHRLLGRRVLDTEEVAFSAAIDPGFHWVVTDHQMSGRAVLPGTAYVELIRAAFGAAAGPGPVELRDLIFTRPLAIDGPRELRVTGKRRDAGGYAFTVQSRSLAESGAPWEQHAQGTAAAYDGPGEPPRHDLSAIMARCDLMTWQPDLTDPDGVVTFGPRWQVVESVRMGRQEQVVELALPAGLDDDIADFGLHPSLLDGATSLGLFVPDLVRDGHSFLPMAYDRVIVRGSIPARSYSHIRSRPSGSSGDIMTFDVAILDEAGRELVTIENFSVRAVDIAAVHASLDAPQGGASSRGGMAGLAQGELMITARQGVELLWRILNGCAESQYVVTRESIQDRARRMAGIATAVESSTGAMLAGTATRDPDAVPAGGEPTTATEEMLLILWQDAFGISRLGVDEDFFDLGGNSLVAVQLAVRIREKFSVNVPGVAVLEYPTVRTLACRVDEALAEAAAS